MDSNIKFDVFCSEWSCICVLRVSISPLPTVLIFNFGIVQTVWYCFFFILLVSYESYEGTLKSCQDLEFCNLRFPIDNSLLRPLYWILIICVLVSRAVDRGFEPLLVQSKNCEIDVCCFSVTYAVLRS